ncbi:MAG: ParB N-terminal domain-containing protein, partial [Chloroflexi bacterium]|nr:ParB N-terminal domain-containing protein [Chloroflexota bacterium]
MKVIDLPLGQLMEAPWNANEISEAMLGRLRESIRRYGVVQNLVVRSLGDVTYEVLSGNQRLKLFREAALPSAPCVVIDIDDAHARLLAEALNRIHGEGDMGLRAELLRKALGEVPEKDVLALLPETIVSLRALVSMGQETIADHLRNWQKVQASRLRHLQFQLTSAQLEVVQKALIKVIPRA